VRVLKESIELTTGAVLEVHTASYRTTRGYTVVSLIADEVSFWLNLETGANPDTEILTALRPGMATVPGALLIGVSTPYARRGELHRAHQRYFGKDDPRVLVWVADTASMNLQLDPAVIAEAFETDPVAAASEYGRDGAIVFRSDVEAFLTPEAVAAVTVQGRRELARHPGTSYVAFVDPSGGSSDAFTLAIAHRQGDHAVLDVVRERRPPFSPEDVTKEFADVLRSYGATTVIGDRYAGDYPAERFATYGITYRASERTKSELYGAVLPMVNSGSVELLDLPQLRAQLLALERRVSRGGKDSIDHLPGGHDDVANVVAGALVNVGIRSSGDTWVELAKGWVLGDLDATRARGTVRTDITPGRTDSRPGLGTRPRPFTVPEACPTCSAVGTLVPGAGYATCTRCAATVHPA